MMWTIMASFAFLLLSVGATFAFQPSYSRRQGQGISSTSLERRVLTRLAATRNGGADAFTAQLQAAHAAATAANTDDSKANALVDSVAQEMMNDSRSAVVESSQSSAPLVAKTGIHDIGGILMQRAIQTQLYYLSDLRDEPTYVWLREFLNHNHLDDRGDFNKLDGLRVSGGWQSYLEQLEQAPHFTITVQLAPPKLSAQQRRNPFLAKELESAGRSYEETIQPSAISQTLRTVARSLEREWLPVLAELAKEDRTRVALFGAPPQLQTAAAAYQAYWMDKQVVAGGEGDDQDTPLHALNCRILTRFCTRVALQSMIEELQADGDGGESKRAALDWLKDFSREWVPRLERGADDDRRRNLGVAPPGHWQRLCDGADAEDVTEAMWQELPPHFAYESDDAMRLYSPGALSARLRRVRADVCDELAEDLRAAVRSMSQS